MLRCTIELLPGGDESRARVIGLVEIANIGLPSAEIGEYVIVLTKTPPFTGALKTAWRRGRMPIEREDEEIIMGHISGHHRTRRGSYDLLYRALRACGLEARLPSSERAGVTR